MDWMLMPLRRYAEFHGRSRRMEYWMFALFNFLVAAAFWGVIGLFMLLMYNAGTSEGTMMAVFTPLLILYCLVALALVIPGLAVTVRRLHDTDKSGWMILLGLIPLVGAILLLIFYLTEGTRGPNRFGPDPKADGFGSPVGV